MFPLVVSRPLILSPLSSEGWHCSPVCLRLSAASPSRYNIHLPILLAFSFFSTSSPGSPLPPPSSSLPLLSSLFTPPSSLIAYRYSLLFSVSCQSLLLFLLPPISLFALLTRTSSPGPPTSHLSLPPLPSPSLPPPSSLIPHPSSTTSPIITSSFLPGGSKPRGL